MMNIHTTQNLDFLSANKYNSHSMYADASKGNQSFHRLQQPKNDGVSFKGKKELVKVTKDLLDKLTETAGKEKKWYDKILTSGFFDKALDMMSHEVFVQAAISCIICVLLRPLTIMALPNKKDKNDNIYASAHSVSSGLMGLASSLLISIPFTKGIKYMQKNLIQNLKPEMLKQMFPNLNVESIWKDKTNGVRKPMEEWLDTVGNKFSREYKNVMKTAKPKPISMVSEETMKTLGGSKNDVSKMNPNDLFIKIKEEGMGKDGKPGENFFSLGYIQEKFLKEVLPELDTKTISKDGKRVNPTEWKKENGESAFDLVKDHLHVSSYRETCESVPIYTGKTRTAEKGEIKYCSYQRNVKDGLGTEINQDMLNKDHANDIKFKLLGWLPDILTRPFVAASTIALIPLVLKEVFHMEKGKKPAPQPQVQEKAVA